MNASHLDRAIAELSRRAASSVVARGRIKSRALNDALLRRLSALPGKPDALLADPLLECANSWETADCTLENLPGSLLEPALVESLDRADRHRLPRSLQPWTHQLSAWQAAHDGFSILVSSGTGSGKTECFMVPMLNDLWRTSGNGLLHGVRAIVVYPLNALIESQRSRLGEWTAPLRDRARFALYNGMTPETSREVQGSLYPAELGNRRDIRGTPPAILVTNVTMLEYLLLRRRDRPILERSQGLLRWIVLDEAHGYIGAQAAEMALLLRRVRTAFGVGPEQVQLIATSATIGEGGRTQQKLTRFVADLAGVEDERVRVIEGRQADPRLPPQQEDTPLESATLGGRSPQALWRRLAPHPRIQRLRRQSERGVSLGNAAKILFGSASARNRAATIGLLNAASNATNPDSDERLLPLRAHLFHRAQGGLWVCVDPSCSSRDPELAANDADWSFGALWLRKRDRCGCGAQVFELVACNECGSPHLLAGIRRGVTDRLLTAPAETIDEFAVDEEPDTPLDDDESETVMSVVPKERVILAPGDANPRPRYLNLGTGEVLDNQPPAAERWAPILIHDTETERGCCEGARTARLGFQRYGPAFFMGSVLPEFVRSLGSPLEDAGRPLGGRRALTFTDSRQGTARLAAKLQQDAERNLTRSFLYHSVQEKRVPTGEEREKKKRKLAKFREFARLHEEEADLFAESIQRLEVELKGDSRPVPWSSLVNRLAQQSELSSFAGDVWGERGAVGQTLAADPTRLAEMFLFRELFRRPRVQNNAETLGLARLAFPELEQAAATNVPPIFKRSGLQAPDWVGLALAAVDFVFRERLAIVVADSRILPFVSPRGRQRSVCPSGLAPSERPARSIPWPGPKPHPTRPSRFHRLVYDLMGGDWTRLADQDRAEELLTALWSLIRRHAARDIGQGAFQLDYSKAAVARLDQAWVCPVTRRIFGYSPGGRSPYDPGKGLAEFRLPRLPTANPGGLESAARVANAEWCRRDETVGELRGQGHWTDLHDRAATYAPFVRAQEHSGQIERPVLAHYEQLFEQGRINLLNCSTTMEMGIDIPNVQVVANSNVPPSISNYRQRMGRAGRRGETWAYGLTFCRDLPLDWSVFDKPAAFLAADVAAPAVSLNSPILVQRHVHAALLGAFVRALPEGLDVKSSTGAFLGALPPRRESSQDRVPEGSLAPFDHDSLAERFLAALRSHDLKADLGPLVRGTALEGRRPRELRELTARRFERLLRRWKREYSELRTRCEAAAEPEVRKALELKARRMHGEFLLSDLARRGFTPAYGFPVDVVHFDHLTLRRETGPKEGFKLPKYGYGRSGSTRTLDMALREYAPGAEIVVDGLVHRSDGVLPAWGSMADLSRLEDLRYFWDCRACGNFGLKRDQPEQCPHCDSANPRRVRTLRPAGFLGRRRPHTGYENLGYTPYAPPRLSAAGAPWRALPAATLGRWRSNLSGRVLTMGSGTMGQGYAVCLDCGRAQSETGDPSIPTEIRKHRPLAPGKKGLRGGFCPGGFVRPERVQRNVHLIHNSRTSVFELQLAAGTSRAAALALASGLREGLIERLGAEAREVGVAASRTKGPSNEDRVSAFLFDRAAGGAGFVSRLAEFDWLEGCLGGAAEHLECPEDCGNGCPACILRPDLNHENGMDRHGGLKLAKALASNLSLPESNRVFGPESQLLADSLKGWLDRSGRNGELSRMTLFLHGKPSDWELAAWNVIDLFPRLRQAGVEVQIVLADHALVDCSFTFGQKLDLHRISGEAGLATAAGSPTVREAPVLTIATVRDRELAVAATSASDSTPGPRWGEGETGVLVAGPAPELPAPVPIPSGKLLALASGNARLVRLAKQLDGPIGSFGRRFWSRIAKADPLLTAAMKRLDVVEATYTDRYLVTPLAARLLRQAIEAMPGRSDLTSLSVRSARTDGPPRDAWHVFEPFPDDMVRRAVLTELLPNADVRLQPRNCLPHARSLGLVLGDGRAVTILFDQGFGAWVCSTRPAHDFRAEPVVQARRLTKLRFNVNLRKGQDAPVVIEI